MDHCDIVCIDSHAIGSQWNPGDVELYGNISGSMAPIDSDHLTRKDYVDNADQSNADAISENSSDIANLESTINNISDSVQTNASAINNEVIRSLAAEAALLDSINNLDSTIVANLLWSEDDNGNITNTNSCLLYKY